MNDEIKRLEAAELVAEQAAAEARAALERARQAREAQLREHTQLAQATLCLLIGVSQGYAETTLGKDVWACRDQLAPLCELYGVRIVECSERKNVAVLEYV